MTTLTQIKKHNKSIDHHFFDRGNSRVEGKKGNFLVTKGFGGGYVVYQYNPSNGHINLVDNKTGAYSAEPYKTKSDAMNSIG